ncbi:unnamed protein product, partial [Staurois parvus]
RIEFFLKFVSNSGLPAKSVSAESSAISDSSLTVLTVHLQRLKHCIYLFPNKNICILNGNK